MDLEHYEQTEPCFYLCYNDITFFMQENQRIASQGTARKPIGQGNLYSRYQQPGDKTLMSSSLSMKFTRDEEG